MNSRLPARAAWLLCLLLLIPVSGRAITFSWDQSGGNERLNIGFSGTIPAYTLSRTGERELTLTFPGGIPAGETIPANADFKGSDMLGSVDMAGNRLILTLKSSDFGYLQAPRPGEHRVQLQVFKDSLGSRWKPTAGAQVGKPAASPAPPLPQSPAAPPAAPASGPAPAGASKTSPAAKAGKAPARAEPAIKAPEPAPAKPVEAEAPPREIPKIAMKDGKPVFPLDPVAPDPADATPQARPEPPAPQVQPIPRRYFSVPYSMRAPVRKAGPEEATMYTAWKQDTPRPSEAAAEPSALSNPAASDQAPAGQPQAAGHPAPAQPHEPSEAPAEGAFTAQTPAELRMRVSKEFMSATAQPAPAAVSAPGAMAEGSPSRSKAASPEATPPTAQEQKGPAAPATVPEAPHPAAPAGNETAEAQKPQAGHGEAGEKKGKKGSEGPTPEVALTSAQTAMLSGNYQEAIKVLLSIRNYPDVPPEVREEALYNLGESLLGLHKDNLKENFSTITGAFKEAMNFNLKSPRVATALLNLGYVNLKVGNVPEAKAYFSLLRKKYPKDEGVPLTTYYWGEYYFSVGKFQDAAREYQQFIQVYPDHKLVREASLGLAKALSELGQGEQAMQIVEYVDKRWPRFYIDYPPFLRLVGDIAARLRLWDRARQNYWTYYNIDPAAEDAHIILAKIGDIYARQGQAEGARTVYQRNALENPDKEGGLISRMRLAEEGVHDTPTMEEMFSIFEKPKATDPSEIYAQIVRDHPRSALAPLAQLKLAMWHMFGRRHVDALQAVSDFESKFPRDGLRQRVTEVGLKAFSEAAAEAFRDGNLGRIADLWSRFPFVAGNRDTLAPEVRLAVAQAMWQRKQPKQALELVRPFMEGKRDKNTEPALDLAMAIYADGRAWSDLVRLGETAKGWDLAEDRRRQLDYAVALSLENLGERDKSRPYWAKLASDGKLAPGQRAYALFHMAQASLENGELKKVQVYGQEALGLFRNMDPPDEPRLRDTVGLLLEASQRGNRTAEAVKWAAEYAGLVGRDTQEWDAAAFRLAQLQRQTGDLDGWRRSLDDIVKKNPQSLYGKMAGSALRSEGLEKSLKQFAPKPADLSQ